MIDKTDMETARHQGRAPLPRRGADRARPDGAVPRPQRRGDRPHHRGLRRRLPGRRCSARSLERTTFRFEATRDDRPQSRLRASSMARQPPSADVGRAHQRADRRGAGRRATGSSRRATISAAAGSASPAPRKLVYEIHPRADGRRQGLRRPDAAHLRRRSPVRGPVHPLAARRRLRPARPSARDGGQFGFATAGGRIRGHIDGVIVAGPDIGVALAGALGAQGAEREVLDRRRQARRRALEADLLRAAAALHGLHGARGGAVHRAQQGHARSSITRSCRFDPAEAQALSDKAVEILRAAEAGSCRRASPPVRTSTSAGCRAAYAGSRCWEGMRMTTSRPPTPQARAIARHQGLVREPHRTSSRCSGCSAMPEPERAPSPRHAIDELGLDDRASRTAAAAGGVLYRRLHRQGGAGDDAARARRPRTIHSLIYRVSEATEEEIERVEKEIARARGRAADAGPARARRSREARLAALRAAPRRHPEAALRPQRAVARARCRADRARRGLDGRRGDGARPAGLRQADPGAGRSRPAAADQGRRRLHQATRPTSC